jgi:hypothetical protein
MPESPEYPFEVCPVTLGEARAFVAEHHRHTGAPTGWKFGAGLEQNGKLVGVAIASRPTARMLDNRRSIEIIRCCTIGVKNACSRLYAAVCRAAAQLGYRRAYTYTLASESGSSLKASGWVMDAEVPAREWGGGRARYVTNLFGEAERPHEAKIRWVKELAA